MTTRRQAGDPRQAIEAGETGHAGADRYRPASMRAVGRPNTLGARLIEAGLVKPHAVERALECQKQQGGTIGHHLIAIGAITADALERFVRPSGPLLKSIGETGIDINLLISLTLKLVYARSLETPTALAEEIKLPPLLVKTILEMACERQLTDSLGGSSTSLAGETRFTLTRRGREWVQEALERSRYVGPAPVSLQTYRDQVDRQRITHDRIDTAVLAASLGDLVLPQATLNRLGPAVNSGRGILLYGPSGNGKTALAMAIARSFQHTVFIPYAIEVDGEIIKVFDPEVHERVAPETEAPAASAAGKLIRHKGLDERWVACRRPLAVTAGEFTLDMLELKYSPIWRFHEAPIQLKVAGGIFLIDDLGRQKMPPRDLLNRLITLLERRLDFIVLSTGKKFEIPFDGLLLFSTNMDAAELIDSAALRRIPYKLFVGAPSRENYKAIFAKACADLGVPYIDGALDCLMEDFYQKNGIEMAGFHPRFIVEHIVARSRYDHTPAVLAEDTLLDAAMQLYI